ncbi:hypothetical protein RIF29_18678 [Crotalaria pallida]|uniref:Uncharacterized protein n=1 Tax=Crotalaria pallida TaxID=3830 RepID=A0AAN9EY73_CROPI
MHKVMVSHLSAPISDHEPILMVFEYDQQSRRLKGRGDRFFFETMWTGYEHCESIIAETWLSNNEGVTLGSVSGKLNSTGLKLSVWSKRELPLIPTQLIPDISEVVAIQGRSSQQFCYCPSQKVYGSQMLLQKDFAVPVRHFAKEAAPPALKGDTMLKNIFVELKNKYETAMGILKQEKITIDTDDPAAVSHYAKVMKTIRVKARLSSESQHIQESIETQTQDIPDARTYLLTLKEIRIKSGLTDDLGAEALMIEALDKIEKDLKKPLLRNDKKGMDLLLAS